MAVTSTLVSQEDSSHGVLACSLGDDCGSQWERGGEGLTVTAVRPSAECTGLATMAFKTGLPFFSIDKPASGFLLCLSKISTTLKRNMKE